MKFLFAVTLLLSLAASFPANRAPVVANPFSEAVSINDIELGSNQPPIAEVVSISEFGPTELEDTFPAAEAVSINEFVPVIRTAEAV